MEKTTKEKSIFALCPAAHIILLVSALITALHLLMRDDRALMNKISKSVVHPLHQRLAVLCSKLGTVSLAEILIGLAVLAVSVYIVVELVNLVRCAGKLRILYRLIVRLASAGLAVYALFCLMWGVYYYGEDFITESGLESGEISTEQLETVTVYFAKLLNEYGDKVERDENGLYLADRDAILAKSPEVFLKIEKTFPCLEGPDISAKKICFSRIMSYLDFTGFFFPFTAEANVNTDFPAGLFASTVAHELSHQRGVAKEQEANFTAVLASLEYGDTDYCYSACMLAYIHLGNALYSADYSVWRMVYNGLSENVLCDLDENSNYWKQFETPVQTVSNTVYEGFLQSYDQTLGLKSYGACVDLLVNYYYPAAVEMFGGTE